MIIPVPYTTEPETREGFPCTAFRWVFEANLEFVGFVHQHQRDDTWYNSHTAVNGLWFNWRRWWRASITHLYYDGPHCCATLGPVTVQWYAPSCPKCHPPKV